MIHHISTATAQEAYDSTARVQALGTETAKMARRLATAFDGAFVSCKLQEKIQALSPEWRVHYYAAFDGSKYASFSDPASSARRFEIRLARNRSSPRAKSKRLESARLSSRPNRSSPRETKASERIAPGDTSRSSPRAPQSRILYISA